MWMNPTKLEMAKEKALQIIERGKGSVIRGHGDVHLGVTIFLEGELLVIQEEMSYRKFKNEGGRIISDGI